MFGFLKYVTATNVTDRGLSILQRPQSITSTSLPPTATSQIYSVQEEKKRAGRYTAPEHSTNAHMRTLWPVHSRTHKIQEKNILSAIQIIHIQRPHWKDF
ncbi:unnamed protein product [Boreogadus saida]